MALIERIALGVDFSEASKVAIRGAFRLSELVGASHLMLLHAVREIVEPAGDQPKVQERLDGLRERIHEAAQKELAAMCAELRPPENLVLDSSIVEGKPAEAIPVAAAEMGASLLLVGSHARKGMRRWLKGSIAEAMLENATIPVLVLVSGDDGVPPEDELAAMKTAVLAVDGTSASTTVLNAGFDFTGSLSAKPKVTVLQVSSDPSAEGALNQLVGQCDAHGVDVELRVASGDVEDVILETASKLGAQLIVVGTHGPELAKRMGSTTTQIMRRSDVVVLVVPCH